MLEKIAEVLDSELTTLRRLDTRAPVDDLKRLSETDPTFGIAFRTLVDRKGRSPRSVGLASRTPETQEIMNAKPGSKGPFTERSYLPTSRIEQLCEDALRSVGLYPDVPSATRIERFIEKKFSLTPEYDALPTGVLGYTVFGPLGPIGMVVNRGLAEADSRVAQRRISTTLAHEAGHCLFHAHLFTRSHQSPADTLRR